MGNYTAVQPTQADKQSNNQFSDRSCSHLGSKGNPSVLQWGGPVTAVVFSGLVTSVHPSVICHDFVVCASCACSLFL